MKGGNTGLKDSDVQGFDYDGVERYGTVDMKGGKGKKVKKGKSNSSKFSEFDFEKEWKEFETSYNQKYGGASSTKKKLTKKLAKKPVKKPKCKTRQRGGDEVGATYAPAQFFDANAQMSAPSSDKSTGSLVDGLFPHSPNNPTVAQTGGAKKKKISKAKTATKTTKPKKESKKDTKNDSKKNDTKSTGKKESVLDKIKKFFAM